MALKLTIPKYDDLSDDLKPLYTKQADGSGLLDAEDDGGPVAGLRKNRDDILKENKRLKEKYGDIDVEAARAALKEKEEREAATAKDKNDWAAREKQLIDIHTAALKKEQDRTSKLSSALYRELVDNVVMKEGTALGGINAKLLLPAIRNSLNVIEESDSYIVQVLDAKGNVRIGGSDGAPMSIKQYLTELREDPEFDSAFLGTGSSGGGSKPKIGGGDRGTPTIAANDSKGFIDNLSKIAKGEVKVA